MDEVELMTFFFPFPALKNPSPVLRNPFPDNKFPNKDAPNVPNNIDKNPPFCSLVSIVLVTPFNKIPEFFFYTYS